LDAQRKHAYRWLLYAAMLDIRPLHWVERSWWKRLNPFCWRSQSQQVRRAGAIADWLHNLADCSAGSFDGFDEDWFWNAFRRVLEKYPGTCLETYRSEFERRAKTLESEAKKQSVATNPNLN
jgi:hypothetical protein